MSGGGSMVDALKRCQAGMNAPACGRYHARHAVCIALALLAFASPAHCIPARDNEPPLPSDTPLPISGRVVTVSVGQEHGPPLEEKVRLPDSVLARMTLQGKKPCAPGGIWDDVYPWLRHGRILACNSPRTVLYLDASGRAVILNEQAGYGQIRALLQANLGNALQDEKRFQAMLDALHYWTVPGGVLGTEKEYKRLERLGELQEWLGRKVKDATLFRKYCRDPVLSHDRKSGRWSLSFYVFNPDGGVSQVNAQGSDKPFRMEELTVDTVMKAGTFHYPLKD